MQEYEPYVYTTRTCFIKYNLDQIVQVDLTSQELLVMVKAGEKYQFDLHVHWKNGHAFIRDLIGIWTTTFSNIRFTGFPS
jgi:hypothetical protein